MVDFSKLSETVRKSILDIASLEGNAKKIDTKKEFDKLSEYLSVNQNLSNEDKEFIQGFMLEHDKSIVKAKNNDNITIRKKDNNFTYTLTLKDPNATEGELTWNGDSLAKMREVYPNAHTAYLKDGDVIILDKDGKPVLDNNGSEVKVEYIPKQKVFSEELAEILVLGHKANPMEKLLHQAEIQKELERLNSLPPTQESYTDIMRSIAFEQMSKKEQTEALLKWSGERFFKAYERKDYATMKEELIQGFALAFQKMDMASIPGTNISIEGFKDFLKTWSGLNLFCEQMDKWVDDGSQNLTDAEKVWEFTKGVGDAVDHFIGTQGIAFMGTLALAGEAAAAGGIGELWAVATQAYFAYEGIGSVAEGVNTLVHAENAEDYRQAGDMVGTGAIMVHGAAKSFKGALTGKLQAGLEVKKAIKEIQETKSFEELKELQDNLPDLPYSEQGKQAILQESTQQLNNIAREKVGTLDSIKNSLKEEGVSYEVFTDSDGNAIVRIVASSERKNPASGVKLTFDCYKYDKDGNVLDLAENISEKDFKTQFGKTKRKAIVDNSNVDNSGNLNAGLPIMDMINAAKLLINKSQGDYTNVKPGTELPKKKQVEISRAAKLQLADIPNQNILDLSLPEYQKIIYKMQDGDKITIGRQGDIQIQDPFARVSRQHLEIEKRDGKYYVTDYSQNGTKILESNPNPEQAILNRSNLEINIKRLNGPYIEIKLEIASETDLLSLGFGISEKDHIGRSYGAKNCFINSNNLCDALKNKCKDYFGKDLDIPILVRIDYKPQVDETLKTYSDQELIDLFKERQGIILEQMRHRIAQDRGTIHHPGIGVEPFETDHFYERCALADIKYELQSRGYDVKDDYSHDSALRCEDDKVYNKDGTELFSTAQREAQNLNNIRNGLIQQYQQNSSAELVQCYEDIEKSINPYKAPELQYDKYIKLDIIKDILAERGITME